MQRERERERERDRASTQVLELCYEIRMNSSIIQDFFLLHNLSSSVVWVWSWAGLPKA